LGGLTRNYPPHLFTIAPRYWRIVKADWDGERIVVRDGDSGGDFTEAGFEVVE
jgi:hypothetical protein